MTDKTQKKVYLTDETEALLDAHPRTNSELVESALNAYLESGELESIERRLDELDRRESVVKGERNERNRELEQIQEQRESLESRRDRIKQKRQSEQEELNKVIDKLSDAPRDPSNPAIKTQASKLGMDPEELVAKLPDNDDDFNSL